MVNNIQLQTLQKRSSQKINYDEFEDHLEEDEQELALKKKVKITKSDAKLSEILIEWRKEKTIPSSCNLESSKQILISQFSPQNSIISLNQIFIRIIKSIDFSKIKFTDYAKDIQAIFINIAWQTKQNPNGKTIQDLENIQFEEQGLVKNGIIFIWTEKELLGKIMDVMEQKNFQYIENFVCIELSKQIAESLVNNDKKGKGKKSNKITNFFLKKQQSTENSIQDEVDIYNLFSKVEASQIFKQDDYNFFKKTKKVLMMFRRFGKDQLELRHQRTSDAIFNVASEPGCYEQYLMEYVYNLIETLLPKAKYTKEQGFKMIQLYGNIPRQDWLTFQE